MTGTVNLSAISRQNYTNCPILVFMGYISRSSSNPPDTYLRYNYNRKYFSYDSTNRKFTCLKSGSVKITSWGTASRNTSGTGGSITVNVYKNSTKVITSTSNGGYDSTTTTINVNDIIYISGGGSGGGDNNKWAGLGFTIELL
jgi:hypothetical protein